MSDEIFEWQSHPNQAFRVHEGPELLGLRDLLVFLPKMTATQFVHHVNASKNDFATWIEDLNGPGSVTRMLRASKTKEEMLAGLARKREEHLERERAEQRTPQAPVVRESAPAQPSVRVEEPTTQVVEQTSPSPDAPQGSPIMDDTHFAALHDEYTKRNEHMQEKFETIATRLKASLDDPMPQDLSQRTDELKEHYEELRVRISDLRKQGKDMLMPSLLLRRIPPKIAWAKAVRERAAFEDVDKMLDAVRAEIDDVLHSGELNIKKEVLAMAGQANTGEESL